MTEPISVVVATRDRPILLKGCLASLRQAVRDGDEIVVVDSASRNPDPIREIAAAHGARYVRHDVPGASRARNAGWRTSRHGIVAFVDDDARVRPGWAEAVANALEPGNGVGFVTGRLDLPAVDRHYERPVAVFDGDESFIIGTQTDEPYGHGANHAARRAALEVVGGFDERLGAGEEFRAAEDLDLWDRLIHAGHVGRYVPAMGGWHEQWRRRRDYVGLDWSYGYGGGVRLSKLIRRNPARGRRSLRLFFWNWGAHLVVEQLRYRQVYLATLTVIRMVGVVVGFGRGLTVPIVDGRLAPPRGGRVRGGRPAGRR